MRIAASLLRIVLAVAGGYALSAALSAGLALGLTRAGMARSEAVVLSSMLGFMLYLAVLLCAFALRRRSAQAVARLPTLRQSMSALHTWSGVLLGGVLFAVFWMGTLSVFDKEIDRWMMPETRLPARASGTPAPITLDTLLAMHAPGQAQWTLTLPTERSPILQLRYEQAGKSVLRQVDPASGALLAPVGTLGGTGFLFPFHFNLHLEWLRLGIWLVGLAGMLMLVLVVSGVVIHAHFFREFFTFRPHKSLARGALDLHTSMGVLALPFHFVMPLSGLIIFAFVYFPGTWQAAYSGDRAVFNRELLASYQRPAAGRPAPLGSLDAMAREAASRWGGAAPSSIRVRNAGDAASVVEMRRASRHQVATHRDPIYFDGVTAQVLQHVQDQPVSAVQRFIMGIHLVQFQHWTLRWLYFLGGLSGCVLMATGLLYWQESRRAQHARQGLAGVRWVELLTIGSVTGIILSTFGFFLANRWLPREANLAGYAREQLELVAFYALWLLSFVHAGVRARSAWVEQCWVIGGLAAGAAASNWLTTGDHLLSALARGVPGVAGMDALLLLAAGCAFGTARHLRRKALPSGAALSRRKLVAPSARRAAHG